MLRKEDCAVTGKAYFAAYKLMRCYLLLLVLLFFCLPSFAQDSALVHQLLQRIQFLQKQSNNNFPTYISNKKQFAVTNKDDNIFYASLISFTLSKHAASLSTDSLLINSIRRKIDLLYPHFQNQKGRLSYNFWRTDIPFVFPYTKWIRLLKKNTSLPDDMDDTVLSLMAQDADSTRAAEAHAIMQEYINKWGKTKTIDKKYRSFKAYSVWYGKHFPPVFDVCVLSNILCFVQQYHLQWTVADSASLNVIVQSITNNDYINKPLFVSPYYGNTSLIVYHVARLMSFANIPQLEALKTKLVTTIAVQLSNTNDLLQKVILSSSLMKLGYDYPLLQLPDNSEVIHQIERSSFPFFTGNIPSYFSPVYKHIFYAKNWLLFYHYCPAYNDALLLEYLLLKKHMSSN